MKFYWWGIFIGLAVLIGYLTGADFEAPANDMFSWVLIGFWLCFTFTFFSKLRQAREYNSQQNTFFFISGTLFLSLFYSFWGDYTDLLTEDFFPDSDLYLNTWMFLFALPYAIYGLFLLVFCFKRYFTVYLGQSALRAQSFGFINALLALIWIIITLLGQYYFPAYEEKLGSLGFRENRIHSDINLLVGLIAIGVFFIWIRYGFFGSRHSVSRIAPNAVSRQRQQEITQSRERESSQSDLDQQRKKEARRRLQQEDQRRSDQRHREQRDAERRRQIETEKRRQAEVEKNRRGTVTHIPRPQQIVRPPSGSSSFNALRPKAGVLSEEDFKCIFCFKLPNDREIILCPNCKHPAHADEFLGWVNASNLCSRCGQAIPVNFRSHPEKISAKTYMEAYRHFLKK